MLNKKISLWQKLNLTLCEHGVILKHSDNAWKKTEVDFPDSKMVFRAFCLSVCNDDRKYLDFFLEEKNEIIQKLPLKIQTQVYSYIGLALYNMGYKNEGIQYIQKSISLCSNDSQHSNGKHAFTFFLCAKLNDIKFLNERLEIAKKISQETPRIHGFDIILAKSYIDTHDFSASEKYINQMKKYNSDSYINIMTAELLFAKKDYKSAAKYYSINKIPGNLSFWRAQFDYRKALAFYYSEQTDEWQKQALKIRRRLRWDRFYRIDDIEDEGVRREPEIDAVIDSNEPDRCLIDTERIAHYLKALIFIAKTSIIRHRYTIPIVIMLLYCLYDFLKRIG